MKNSSSQGVKFFLRVLIPFITCIHLGSGSALAGLTFVLDFYRQSQGQSYVFYTPMATNAISPATPPGTYVFYSPGWPTNGSVRGFEITTNGLVDIPSDDSEYGYSDFNSAIQQITNGTWRVAYSNATTTNLFTFTVSAPGVTSNALPATFIDSPVDGSFILSNQTAFSWSGPATWPVIGNLQIFGGSYYQATNLPAASTNWTVDTAFPLGTNFTFYLHYLTNYTTPLFVASTPLDATAHPISGWASSNILETGSSVTFGVFIPGQPSRGHVCVAYYTFEDSGGTNLFAHDFSGAHNDIRLFSYYMKPPYITNDAEAGSYAFAASGDGWLSPSTNLTSALEGSFSLSLWLKTTNVHGGDQDNVNVAGGIVSDLSGDYVNVAMPMGLTGSKLAFYTGGSYQNILYSRASINTGQYVHLVTTRDQNTGEKRIYVNGVLDSALYSDTDLLTGMAPDGLTIGYNSGQPFTGEMDEIQFYIGVLSGSDVSFLYGHPGTNVADTSDVSVPLVARYDFENTNAPGTDSSGHNINSDCSNSTGPLTDVPSTNAAVGTYARRYFGNSSFCFYPYGMVYPALSNALSGSFSVTAWVNTTNSTNFDYANAYFGLPILFGYSGATNSTVPLSITGSKAAFTVTDQNGAGTTLHSTTTVNDGRYHFLAVTRNQTNGQMNLYVDGGLEATGTNTTQKLLINTTLYIAGGYFAQYEGLLDDVRIYGGALTPGDVAYLGASPSFNVALDTTGLPWTTGGSSIWFVENTNTSDGVSAAQSGSVISNQTSTLSVSVTGPGTLTFQWSSIANDPNQGFDLEFYIDDPNTNDIADLVGDNSWQQYGPVSVPAGQHILGWTVNPYGDTDPTQAGFLDQVVFTPAQAAQPVTILNAVNTGSNFQFQFASKSGFMHVVQYKTDLTSAGWNTYSTIAGDGTTKNVSIPLSVFGTSKQGFVRVSTQ
jgi:Concanavalin A-like lectin/glucanases superfamily